MCLRALWDYLLQPEKKSTLMRTLMYSLKSAVPQKYCYYYCVGGTHRRFTHRSNQLQPDLIFTNIQINS